MEHGITHQITLLVLQLAFVIFIARIFGEFKEETIVPIQITRRIGSRGRALKIETENEADELYRLWDTALIHYARNTLRKILNLAHDKKRVEQEMK